MVFICPLLLLSTGHKHQMTEAANVKPAIRINILFLNSETQFIGYRLTVFNHFYKFYFFIFKFSISPVTYLGHHDNNKILFFYLIVTDNLRVLQNFACNATDQQFFFLFFAFHFFFAFLFAFLLCLYLFCTSCTTLIIIIINVVSSMQGCET